MKKVVFAAMMALSCTFAFAGTNPVQTDVLKTNNNTLAPNAEMCRAVVAGTDISVSCATCQCAVAKLIRVLCNMGNQAACDR
jgi:hypothetical protein